MAGLKVGDKVTLIDTGQRAVIDQIHCYTERVRANGQVVKKESNLIRSLVVSILSQNGHQNDSRICRQITPDLIEGWENV